MMKNNVRKITIVGVLSALSVVLMIFPKFSLIPAFPFLEVDFSDVISLFAAACLSPSAGVLVVLIKNAVHLLMTSTGAVGELSNFICGASFVFAFGSVFHRAALSKNKYLHLLLSLIVGCARADNCRCFGQLLLNDSALRYSGGGRELHIRWRYPL